MLELIILANQLDAKGYSKMADELDNIIASMNKEKNLKKGAKISEEFENVD